LICFACSGVIAHTVRKINEFDGCYPMAIFCENCYYTITHMNDQVQE
jgi:hypothetical protein